MVLFMVSTIYCIILHVNTCDAGVMIYYVFIIIIMTLTFYAKEILWISSAFIEDYFMTRMS